MNGEWSKETMHKLSTAKTVTFKFKKFDGSWRLMCCVHPRQS